MTISPHVSAIWEDSSLAERPAAVAPSAGQPDLIATYQRARIVGGVMGAVGLVGLAVALDWATGIWIAAMAVAVVGHAWHRTKSPASTPIDSVLIDATAVALGLLLARPPGLVAIPPLAYLVAVAPLMLSGRSAAWAVAYTMTATGAALVVSQASGVAWDLTTTSFLMAVTVTATVPGMFRMLQTAARAMAANRQLGQWLDQRDQRYRGLVDGIPVGMYRSTPEGRIIMANPALADLLGYDSPAALMEIPVASFYGNPNTRLEWRSAVEGEGTVRAWEIPLTRADGEAIWVRDTARVVRDENDEILYYEGMIEDVTDRKRAEDALLESEDRYRRLVEASPLAIAVHCDNVMVYANRATAEILGADTPEELIGRPVIDFVHPDHREVARERIRMIVDEGRPAALLEEKFIRVDGAVVEVEVTGIPTQHRGKPASQVVIRDVTAHKKAEREARARSHELERLFALTAAVNAGRSFSEILNGIFDSFRELIPYDRMEYADLEENGAVLRTRWVRADYDEIALPVGHVYRRPEPGATSGEAARPMIDNDLPAYARSRPPDNPTHLLVEEGLRSALSCPLVLHDQIVGYLFFSSRKPAVYQSGHATLVDRVATQIAGALEQSRLREALMMRNVELENLNRSRTQFLANVSHELRTPLTAVVGLAAEMRDRLPELGREEIVDFAELIASSSSEVAGIVEDLLVIARVEAGQLSVVPEQVSLGESVRLAIETWNPEEASLIKIDGDEAEAWADPLRVRQIVRNLCSNARRYGGERLEIRIRGDGEKSVVVVADDGPGIPEKEREAVFEAYVAAGADRTRSSVGLGLTVSRQLARAMGGDLGYEFDGKESRFVLSLPAATP